MDIAAWLRELGLERYQEAFRDNEIDGEVLPTLTADDLKDLGVAVIGHRRKLMNAIAALGDVEAVLEPAAAPRAEAERRQLTVMFCDLVGSTALSAQLDPEDMREVIRGYQDACAGVITRFDGFVAKYMGDGVLAYFGYPRAHEDDAERAVRAGLALTEAVARLATPTNQTLAARIGIATGLVVVGDLVGEGASQEQAVVGDTPNLAARLQGVAEPGQVVIADGTRRLVGAGFDLEDLGPQALKGLAEPAAAFAVLDERATPSRFEARSPLVLPMVGRDQELALLLERWSQAKTGEGQGVLLVGEAGIGKSRITRALLDSLVEEPHTRIRYQCSPYYRDSALWPVIQQLGHAAGFTAEDSSTAKLDKLEAVLDRAGGRDAAPLIASLVGLDGTVRYDLLDLTPQAQRVRTLDALVEQLIGLAHKLPVLIVLEDAHWIDPSTLEMIGQALDLIAKARVLIVLTSRPDQQPELAGHPHMTRLTLNRLSRRGVEAIVTRLGGDRLPSDTIDAIIGRTDGVPLFVEELTKAVLETGEATIPALLHDSLMARLDRIPEVKEVAQIAACIGREFDYPVLAAIVKRSEPDLLAALDRLGAAELVFRRGTPPEATYSFKHALVADAAYQSLLKSKRQDLHARIGKTLARQFAGLADSTPELLAHHLTEAGLADQAVVYWRRAGELANRGFANGEAVTQLNRALELLATLPETRERDVQELEIREAIIPPLRMLHGYGTSDIERCVERTGILAARLGDERRRLVSARLLISVRLMRVSVKKALQLGSSAVRSVNTLADPGPVEAGTMARYGYVLMMAGQFVEAEIHLTRSLEILKASPVDALSGDPVADNEAVVGLSVGMATAFLGQLDRAAAIEKEGIALARRLKDPRVLLMTLCYALHRCAYCRDLELVRILAGETLALAQEQHARLWHSLATFFLGWASSQDGEPSTGISDMERAIGGWQGTGARLHSTTWYGLLAEARLWAGDAARARHDVDAALYHARDFGERYLEAELHRIDAACRRHEGGSAREVEQALLRAISIAEAQKARLWELRAAHDLARLWAEQGERQKAHDLFAPLYAGFTEGLDTPDLKNAKALLDELR